MNRTFSSRLPSWLGTAAALALLAGCTASPTVEYQPAVAEATKTNDVAFSRIAHTVHFAPGNAALTSAEAARLARFLEEADVYRGDHVFLDPTPDDPLSQKRQAAIRRALAKRGVLMSSSAAVPGAGERLALGDEMTIELERYVVTPPNCPDWSKPSGGDPTNSVSSNFGCADVTNLGLMVANPRDLLVGRQPGPASAEPALGAIQNYRAHKPITLPDGNAAGTTASSSGPATGTGNPAGGSGSGS
jgi:pilus assembly protein CpaD